MIILSQYKVRREGNGIFRVYDMPFSYCSVCKERLRVRDSRIRSFMDSDGRKYFLRHRRLMCSNCGKIHSELPDFIMPGKRYTADVILRQLFGNTQNGNTENKDMMVCVAEESTIYRWAEEVTCRLRVIFLFLEKCFKLWSGVIECFIRLLKILENMENVKWSRGSWGKDSYVGECCVKGSYDKGIYDRGNYKQISADAKTLLGVLFGGRQFT